jgi:hypothetical protein
LLGRAIEQLADGMVPARITYDILSPVRVVPLRITSEIERPGKKVRLIRAALIDEDREVMRAHAWMVRSAEVGISVPVTERLLTPPEALGDSPGFPTTYDGYLEAMEFRFAHGSFAELGPAATWLRMRHPLIEGEEPSPLTRVLIAADSASGVSSALDWRDWLFINVDLSVYLHRLPRGEWVCLDATSTIEPQGVGLASSVILDEEGPIGRTEQSLFVDRRDA